MVRGAHTLHPLFNKGLRQGALKGLDSGVKVVLIVLVTLNIG